MKRRLKLLGAIVSLCLIIATSIFVVVRSNRQSLGADPAEVAFQTDAVKLNVNQDGFYQLKLHELQQAGLALEAIDVADLNLSQNGESIPIWVDGESFVFYGQASSSRYAPYQTYILATGESGTQMEVQTTADIESPLLESVPQTVILEENTLYDSRARYDEDGTSLSSEPWYWTTIQVESQVPIELSLNGIVEDRPATLKLSLWGATHNDSVENDHDFDVVVNGENVGTVRWDGETHFVSETIIPPGLLESGPNEILLDNSVPGATQVDIMRLDRLSLTYEAPVTAIDNRLVVAGIAGRLAIGDFSDQPHVFNISDPRQPTQLEGWAYEAGRLELGAAEDQTIAAIVPDAYLKPVSVELLRQTDWPETHHQADLIIVTTDELAPALSPLVAAREEQGLSVAVVPVADIYDEFGYGQPEPDVITDFLRYASENWSDPKPRYLLLVGEATYDYRNYLAPGPVNQVPAPIVSVSYSGETVSDARLADLDGDMSPDMAVGRWPVDTPKQVTDLVDRTLTYEQGTSSSKIIFTADGTSTEFSSLSDTLIEASMLDNGQEIERLYGATADQVIESWNEGSWLISYVGHGSLDRWGKEDVFTTEAIEDVNTRTSVPIVLQLTCLTGFFAHPEIDSLSETMLRHKNGPVLIVAATSLTLSSSQKPFGIEFLRALQDPSVARMGDALQAAKLSLDVSTEAAREISDTFGLLGDPSALISRPQIVAVQ